MTVLEVLIFMTALAIAVLLTVPGFSRLIANHRLTSTSDELVQTVQTARREALKRHTTVRVCPSSDGQSCDGHDAWEQGWLIKVKLSAKSTDHLLDAAAYEQMLAQQG